MKLIRTTLYALSLVLLALGYGASQFAYLSGDPRAYTQRVDAQPIIGLALLLLLASVLLPFVRSKKENPKS